MRNNPSAWYRLLLVPLIVLSGVTFAQALAPTQITYSDFNVVIPFYGYSDSGNCVTSCLKFSSSLAGGGHDAATYTGKWANFTNFAFGSLTNPAQSFAVGVKGAIATENSPASDHIEFTESFSSGNPMLHLQYVMPSGSAYAYPPTMIETVGSSAEYIQSSGYYLTASAFSSCGAPCVYLDQSNRTIIAKALSISPVTWDIYYIVNNGAAVTTSTSATGVATGNGPQGGGGTVVTTSTISGSVTVGPPPSVGTPQNYALGSSLLAVLIIVVLGFSYYINHSDVVKRFNSELGRTVKRKAPKHGRGSEKS